MRLNSWRQVLEHALERGELMDELNCVTALHRVAKLYREEEQKRGEILQHEGFQVLVELTKHFAVRCRPQQIANALWSFAVLMYQDQELISLLCRLAFKLKRLCVTSFKTCSIEMSMQISRKNEQN